MADNILMQIKTFFFLYNNNKLHVLRQLQPLDQMMSLYTDVQSLSQIQFIEIPK